MGLSRHTIAWPFSGGIDDHVAPPHRQPPKLRRCVNAWQEKSGGLRMRRSTTALSTSKLGGGSIDAATGLHVHGDTIIVRDGDALYGYSVADTRWRSLGDDPRLKAGVEVIAHDRRASTRHVDVAAGGGLIAYVYSVGGQATGGAIYADIRDASTGLSLTGRVELRASGGNVPKVTAVPDAFVFTWADESSGSSALVGVRVAYSSPTTFGSEVPLASDLSGTSGAGDGAIYEVAAIGTTGNILVTWYAVVATDYFWRRKVISGSTLADVVAEVSSGLAGDPDGCIGILDHDYADGKAYVALGANYGVTIVTMPLADLSVTAMSDDPSAGLQVWNVTGRYSGGQVEVYYEVSEYGTIWVYRATGTLSALVPALVAPRASIASHVFALGGKTYIMLANYSANRDGVTTPQDTYFVVGADALVVARLLYRVAGPPRTGAPALAVKLSNRPNVPKVLALSATKVLAVGVRAIEIDVGINVEHGLVAITLEHGADLGRWSHATTSFQAGALGCVFDGEDMTECGFLESPQPPTIEPGETGSLQSDATYGYAFVWSWIDGAQQLHRSAPTFVDVTLSSTETSAVITAPSLPWTRRRGLGAKAVELEGYRTAANGSTYRKLFSIQNDPSAHVLDNGDGWTHNDAASDDAIAANEPLYAQGGVLVNHAPPPSLCSEVYDGRVWVVNAEEPREVWHSKLVTSRLAPAFTDAMVVRYPEPIVALAVIDDKLVAFSRSSRYVLVGPGPDNTGAGLYAQPQRVQGAVGARSPTSVASTPAGIIRVDDRGAWMLGRDLSDSYVGADAEDTLSWSSVTGIDVASAYHQVRIATGGGTTVVYDYLHGWWGLHTGQGAVGSAVWRGAWCYVTALGVVHVEGSTVTTNPGYTMVVETPRIAVPSLRGHGRVKRLAVLGEYVSPHTVVVGLRYDGDDTASAEEHTFASSALVPALSAGKPERIDVMNAIEVCEQIAAVITVTPAEGAGEPAILYGLAVDVAAKGGLGRLDVANAK